MASRHIVSALASLFAVAASRTMTTTAASASVTSLFFPGFVQTGLVASVITAAPAATTYLVQCSSEYEFDCELGEGVILTEGPSTFEVNVNSTDMTISEACAMTSGTASCTFSIAGSTSGTESASGLKSMYLNVTITAGFEALASASSIAAAEAAAKTAQVTAMDVPSSTTFDTSATATDNASRNAAMTTADQKMGAVLMMVFTVAGTLLL
ncbi:hypothetical protein BKA67DRAFT_529828 [Truncatella angustata]|uniref:GPI anchored cell wall protein n=1 Tax=Truncatella angustata TaxID=152316 RepID=A0A9P9A1L6_9PEZI|nr:uncharacterized protein BKA67DRAFT_529828 [Truncatella angustata]KAH6659686.1 hypothetical protein BKA67DRAFT_529828 [Truncatella angustata]KAH8194589.1 hypothetical protein TruAng_011239 [Truncatella angustata]